MPVVQLNRTVAGDGAIRQHGPELLRIKDRHGRDYMFSPPVRKWLPTLRAGIAQLQQLPKHFYQIQTKFRDERRPRFGLMRGREFTMKDAYSFDRDQAAARMAIRSWRAGLPPHFDRFGLTHCAVAADSGAIGGDLTRIPGHRGHRRGRHRLLPRQRITTPPIWKPPRRWRPPVTLRPAAAITMAKTPHRRARPPAPMGQLLGVPLQSTVKSLVATDETNWRRGRGSRSGCYWCAATTIMNRIKVANPGARCRFRFATLAEDRSHFGCTGLPGPDQPASSPCGRGRPRGRRHGRLDLRCHEPVDFHHRRQLALTSPELEMVADLRNVVANDASPDGNLPSSAASRGHVFYLGTKYSWR